MDRSLRCVLLHLTLVLSLSCIQAQILDCDFENDADPLCGFYNADSSTADYKRGAGYDHTYSNGTGHFVNTGVSLEQRESVAVLYSPTIAIPADTSQLCLEFFFTMNGPPADTLRVYTETGGVKTTVLVIPGTNRQLWEKAEITLEIGNSSSTNIQLVFEATITWTTLVYVSLDDIKLSLAECAGVHAEIATTTPAAPLASYECTFDDPGDGRCTPRTNDANNFDWMFKQAGIRPNNQAPVYDHTTSTTAGLYLYVPQDGGQTANEEIGEFRTPLLQATFQPKCLEFYYYMRGNQVGTLNGYTTHNGLPPPAVMPWNKTGDQGGYWTRGLMDIHPTFASYQIVFEAIRPRGYAGCIAVDDLRLKDGRCPAEELQCDFETTHLCFFTQDRTDDMDWIIGNGASPSYGTGPSNDHTYGNSTGFYMYIETSSPAAVGHVARLVSPPLTETHGHAHCLIFWYHMYGIHVDALNVLIANATTPTERKLIWSLAGNRGNKWRAAEVHVTSFQDFVVIFEATRGSSYQGDIAIDDVWVTSTEGCPGEAGLKNFSSITCDFEEIEICYWAQDSMDDFDWTWQNAASQDLTNTGPTEDHTTGSQLGFYMYIQEDYTTAPGGAARLMTPVAKIQSRQSCLEFYYHMYGRDIESLSVYIMKSSDTELPSDPVWSMVGDKGNYWHRATIDIPSTDYTFKFVFEGTRGQSYRDNIAIDDVKFYEGQNCPIVTTVAPVPTTTPTPIASANCDFEDPDGIMCGYMQSIYDEMDWSHGSGTPISKDHTLGTGQGHYIYLYTEGYYQRYDDRADLYSPLLMKSDQQQCLEFYYYLSGYSADFLLIYLTPWGASLAIDPHFSLFGDQGEQWNAARVEIPAMETNFQVVFEALFGSFSEVAIDDIKFTMGPCPSVATSSPNPIDGRCDFEDGLDACGYENYRLDFYWLKNSGKTASEGTGPKVDHTTGTENGQYMYIEASLPQRPEQRARMLTPQLFHQPGTPLCMVFYYHMNGANVGVINTYSQDRTGTKPLLTLRGNSQDLWQPAGMDLTNLGPRFQVIFEGVTGFGVDGDMAIDDVSLRNEPCPGFAKSAEIDFEMPGEMNGFEQYWTGTTYWKWYDQYTEAQSTLPKELLETSDGSFMYIDASMFDPDTQASIISPLMAGHATEHCLDFDYAIQNDGSLLVTIEQTDGVKQDLMVKDGLTTWAHVRRSLTRAEVGQDFRITFTGKVGSAGNGYIAVDNLVIREGSCDQLSKPGEPVGQASSGGSVAAAVLLAVLLAVAIGVIAIGGVYFIRRRQLEKNVPSVHYNSRNSDDANGKTDGSSLSKDLSIANPNYDNAPLQTNA